jgi:FMN phosphatase YigB (HAD superfamily)
MMPVFEWVVLDIGETVLSDTRLYATRARRAGIEPWAVGALVGSLRERPGSRPLDEILLRALAPGSAASPVEDDYVPATEENLYPDVQGVLRALRRRGIRTALAGNQPNGVADDLRALSLPIDFVLTSSEAGVKKPDPDFFEQIVSCSGAVRERILYVGDQVRTDVVAATDAGLNAVHLVRGPWGLLDADDPDVARLALGQVTGLDQVLDMIDALGTSGGESL